MHACGWLVDHRGAVAFDELGLSLASAGEARGLPLRGVWTFGSGEGERTLSPLDTSNRFRWVAA